MKSHASLRRRAEHHVMCARPLAHSTEPRGFTSICWMLGHVYQSHSRCCPISVLAPFPDFLDQMAAAGGLGGSAKFLGIHCPCGQRPEAPLSARLPTSWGPESCTELGLQRTFPDHTSPLPMFLNVWLVQEVPEQECDLQLKLYICPQTMKPTGISKSFLCAMH